MKKCKSVESLYIYVTLLYNYELFMSIEDSWNFFRNHYRTPKLLKKRREENFLYCIKFWTFSNIYKVSRGLFLIHNEIPLKFMNSLNALMDLHKWITWVWLILKIKMSSHEIKILRYNYALHLLIFTLSINRCLFY